MINIILKYLTGGIVDKVVDLVKSYQGSKLSEKEIEAQVQKEMTKALSDITKSQADVIMTEMKGESWLQRNWRPITALTLLSVTLWYAIGVPIAVDWMGMPPLRVGEDQLIRIDNIIVICLGGYIGGRTLEKMVTTWKS